VTDDGDESSEPIAPDPDAEEPGFESGADVPDGEPLDIPLPWNTIPDEGAEDAASEADASDTDDGGDGTGADTSEDRPVPAEFEELRFVGPKSAPLLAASEISVADIWKKRVSYRDLTDAGVNPGVAAKIRREHSLSWSLDGGGTDLDRRSDQIRGLDDDERAWIAESSGWSESDSDADAEADGSGNATAGEAVWQARTNELADDDDSDTDGSPSTAGEAAWRAGEMTAVDEAEDADDTDDRDADDADRDAAAADRDAAAADRDAESIWRDRSAPTPLTAVDGFDDDVATTLRKAGIGSVRRLATADPESVADALDIDLERVRSWRQRARDHDADGRGQ
jgi:hypothetical protein